MVFCDRFTGIALIVSLDGHVTYWSPAAAAEFGWSEMEARGLGIQGLFSTAGESPNALRPQGAGSHPVKVLLKGERTAIYESQIVPMVDPGGCVYGHLYLLRPAESGGKVTGNSAPPPPSRRAQPGGKYCTS
jgi:PAS domain-containing protein